MIQHDDFSIVLTALIILVAIVAFRLGKKAGRKEGEALGTIRGIKRALRTVRAQVLVAIK